VSGRFKLEECLGDSSYWKHSSHIQLR
jgi:hypothetical protein